MDGFGDLATEAFAASPDYGAYFAPQSVTMPTMPAFDPIANLNIGKAALAAGDAAIPRAGSDFGWGDLAGAARGILPWVGAGTGVMGAIAGVKGAEQMAEANRIGRQGMKLQQETARQTQAAAAPLAQFGTKQLALAESGALPPAIQAKIEEWKAGAIQQARDYAARSGQGDSMMLTEWESWINQQAEAMAASYLQEMQQLGVQGLTAGAGALSGAGATAGGVQQTAMGQSHAIENLIAQSNQVMSRLTAGAA
jgi:hypothetical protein